MQKEINSQFQLDETILEIRNACSRLLLHYVCWPVDTDYHESQGSALERNHWDQKTVWRLGLEN